MLNGRLLTGLNLYPGVFHSLFRFKLDETGVAGDIEQGFLQIGLESADELDLDRGAVRILWMKTFFHSE